MAWSAEQRVLNMIEFRLRVLGYYKAGGTKPEPPRNPPYATDRDAKEQTANRKMEAWQRRQNKT